MDGYICLKTGTFNGVQYDKGDIIPTDAVLPSRVPALVKQKCIAETMETSQTTQITPKDDETENWVNIPIKSENGVMELPVTREGVIQALEIMQLNAENAAAAIASVESEEVLIVIDATDSRKTIKTAIKARVTKLKENETENDTPADASKQGESQGD